jgi:hypothetical protein
LVHAPKEHKLLVKENILPENMRDRKDRISTEEVRQVLGISTFHELIALPYDQCLKRLHILENLGYWFFCRSDLQPSMSLSWMESRKILCRVAGFIFYTSFVDGHEIFDFRSEGELYFNLHPSMELVAAIASSNLKRSLSTPSKHQLYLTAEEKVNSPPTRKQKP